MEQKVLEEWAFRMVTAPDPQALSRVLNLFSQRDILVERLVVAPAETGLQVAIPAITLDEHAAQVIAGKLRAMVLVAQVDLARSNLAA